MNGFGDKQGKVGWFSDAAYEDGTPVAYVATIQEFGSIKGKIPPRSFFRTTMVEKKEAWALTAEQAAKALLSGSETPDTAMNKIALMAQGDVQKKITEIVEPALSEITILLRQYRRDGGIVTGRIVGLAAKAVGAESTRALSVDDKPLIDTGHMLHTLSSKVE